MTTMNTDTSAERAAICLAACDGIPSEKLRGKTIAQYVAGEAYLTGATPGADGFNMGLSGIACQMFASSFAGQFKGSGAINFLQVNMEHTELGAFFVTIQRADGKTPAQLKREAEQERDEAKAEVQRLQDRLRVAETALAVYQRAEAQGELQPAASGEQAAQDELQRLRAENERLRSRIKELESATPV
jgi:hypothetical protein